jgi:hypothetical protein
VLYQLSYTRPPGRWRHPCSPRGESRNYRLQGPRFKGNWLRIRKMENPTAANTPPQQGDISRLFGRRLRAFLWRWLHALLGGWLFCRPLLWRQLHSRRSSSFLWRRRFMPVQTPRIFSSPGVSHPGREDGHSPLSLLSSGRLQAAAIERARERRGWESARTLTRLCGRIPTVEGSRLHFLQGLVN